jgi:hypothetical protein
LGLPCAQSCSRLHHLSGRDDSRSRDTARVCHGAGRSAARGPLGREAFVRPFARVGRGGLSIWDESPTFIPEPFDLELTTLQGHPEGGAPSDGVGEEARYGGGLDGRSASECRGVGAG